MDFDTEDTEAIAKAAIEYLIAQEKPFEASLLLRSKLSLEMVRGISGSQFQARAR